MEDGEGENSVQEDETEEKWFSLGKHGWMLPAGFGLANPNPTYWLAKLECLDHRK